MSNVVRWVSFALSRLHPKGGTVTLAELRRFMEAEFGAPAVAISDAELRTALLKLNGPTMSVSSDSESGASVTCTPLPEGWIPLEKFKRSC